MSHLRHLLIGPIAAALLASCGGDATQAAPAAGDTDAGSGGAGGSGGSGGGSSDAGAGGDTACPTDLFLDVSKAPGAGAGYPAPQLTVSCTDTTMTVTSNDIPFYTFVATTPNALKAQTFSWTVPLAPVRAAQPTGIVNQLGTLGFTVAGAPFYGPTEGPVPPAEAYGDPVYNGLLDDCMGHTGYNGDYHHHALFQKCLVASGLVAEPWMNAEPSPDEPSPILGFALDGFPVYGPYECVDASCTSMHTLQSSYVETGDPKSNSWQAYTFQQQTDAAHLDACNGHVGPRGDYHYHATTGFPYIIGCFAGTATGVGAGAPGTGGTGGTPPTCMPGQTAMCCGDGKCDGPETNANCAADCP